MVGKVMMMMMMMSFYIGNIVGDSCSKKSNPNFFLLAKIRSGPFELFALSYSFICIYLFIVMGKNFEKECLF
jgi:hypothetical protein